MLFEHQFIASCEVGDRSRHPAHTVVAAPGELVAFELVTQASPGVGVQGRQRIESRLVELVQRTALLDFRPVWAVYNPTPTVDPSASASASPSGSVSPSDSASRVALFRV